MLVQGILPFLGHAAIVKTLRLLIVPFIVLFAVLLGFSIGHAHLNAVAHGAGWQTYLAGLGLHHRAERARLDRVRERLHPLLPDRRLEEGTRRLDLPRHRRPRDPHHDPGRRGRHVRRGIGTGAGGLLPFAHQSVIPAWFVVVFLVFAVVQFFAINSLDMYSSGVTLQAIGLPVKRYQAVVVDCVIALGITMYAIFSSSFTTVPGGLRRPRDRLDRTVVRHLPGRLGAAPLPLRAERAAEHRADSLYWNSGGIFWPAIVAQVVGMFAAFSALSATFHLPQWLNEVTYHNNGADFSIFLGMGVGGAVYYLLAHRAVATQADAQEELLQEEGLLAPV